MIPNSQIKFIKSLGDKKSRNEHKMFVAEGIKIVGELIGSDWEVVNVFATTRLMESLADKDLFKGFDFEFVSEKDLERMTQFSTHQSVLAVVKMKEFKTPPKIENIVLVLDGINDPGNLGTIIRLADWFGVKQIVCSKNTVDCYNPKVVQSTMGSFLRTELIYADLVSFISGIDKNIPVLGTLMEGDSLYQSKFKAPMVLVMGSESHGISTDIVQLLNGKIHIPSFNPHQHAESLNVGTATAICLSEICRQVN